MGQEPADGSVIGPSLADTGSSHWTDRHSGWPSHPGRRPFAFHDSHPAFACPRRPVQRLSLSRSLSLSPDSHLIPHNSYSHPTQASHPDRCRCSHLLPCHGTRHKVSSQDGAFFTLCSASTWLYSTSSPRSLLHTLQTTIHPPTASSSVSTLGPRSTVQAQRIQATLIIV